MRMATGADRCAGCPGHCKGKQPPHQFKCRAILLNLLPASLAIKCKTTHAFTYDLARAPETLDIGRAVALIADHAPPPIEYTWEKDGLFDRWKPAFPPFAGAAGHGDAVNFTWRLIKAGHREPLVKAALALPETKADKVFAMLATFADARLRQAAAAHFELPSLPQMMEMVFKDLLSLEDHALLADFGAQNARYRAGLVSAMQAYGLHLYSNYRPKADWSSPALSTIRARAVQLYSIS